MVRGLWEAGPVERPSVAQDGDEVEIEVSEDDLMGGDVVEGSAGETKNGPETPEDEQPIWGNLRRKPGSS